MDNLIITLKKYNFSEYETKAYITLLKLGKATGYEISKSSTIPRSKIYNVLENLKQKGVVLKTTGEQPYFIAVEIEELLKTLERNFKQDLDSIDLCLQQYQQKTHKNSDIYNLDGYNNIINKVKLLIEQASSSLLIQIWKEEIDDELLSLLIKAENRIDNFILIIFSEQEDYQLPLERYFIHHFDQIKKSELHSRWINLVINDEQMIMATIYNHHLASAVTTHYQPMVFLAKEYILHDAYTANILERLDERALKLLGTNLEAIRSIYKK